MAQRVEGNPACGEEPSVWKGTPFSVFTFMLSVWFPHHENLGPIFNPLLCRLWSAWFIERRKH